MPSKSARSPAAVDVGSDSFFDASAGAVKRFDDRAIVGLAVERS
jgi:hypothetical protein